MEKKLTFLTIGIIIGILIKYYLFPEMNLIILLVLFLLFQKYKSAEINFTGLGLLIIIVSLLVHNYNYFTFDSGMELQIEGKVVKTYTRYDDYQRIEVKSNIINGRKNTLLFSVATISDVNFSYGDRVEFRGVVEERRGNKNFGLTDINELQKIMRISNSLITRDIVNMGSDSKLVFFRNNVVNYIIELFDENLSPENSGILKKLILADSKSIKVDLNELYSETGISHLLAISGLHIMIIISLLNNILSRLGLGYNIKFAITSLFLISYGYILGFPPSVSRAMLMYFILIVSEYLEIKISNKIIVLFAAVILLVINPHWLFDIGFQLSFGAVIGIAFLKERLFPMTTSELLSGIQIYTTVNIAIFPILAMHFNNFNLLSLITNLLMTPVVTVVLILGYLSVILSLVLTSISYYIFTVIDFILEAFNFYLTYTLEYFSLPLRVKYPSLISVVIYYIVILILLSSTFKRKIYKYRKIFAIYMVMTLVTHAILISSNSLTVGFFDVGQGDSSYLYYKGKYIQIDTGGTAFSSYNPGVEITKRAIKKRGINKIDLMILSHLDLDHVGGVKSMLESKMIDTIILGESERASDIYLDIMGGHEDKIITLNENSKLDIDEDLSIRFLNVGTNSLNSNDNSLVCLVQYKDNKILYTGDIGKVVEELLISDIGNVDILKVSHHGSASSTSIEFLNIARPKYSVISVGKNSYGHPYTGVLENLKSVKSNILRTDIEGEIIFSIGDNISYYSYSDRRIDVFSIIYFTVSVIIGLIITTYISNKGEKYELQRL